MYRRTDQLTRGDRVHLPMRGIVRTVDTITPAGYDNHEGDPIYTVRYQEGRTPEWSEGNTAIAETLWQVEPIEPGEVPPLADGHIRIRIRGGDDR